MSAPAPFCVSLWPRLYCSFRVVDDERGRSEEDVPTEHPQAQEDARIPQAYEHAGWSGGHQAAAAEGAQASLGLTGQMTGKRSRLSRSSDFQRIYRQGSSTASRFLVLYSFRRPAEVSADGPRLGLSVSRKMGGAVVRNHIKRLLREAFGSEREQLAEDHDFVLIARPPLLELIAREREGEKGLVRAAVRDLMGRAGFLPPESSEQT